MTRPLLMIEDTLSLQMLYQNILQHAGYDVVAAGTAREGRAMFREYKPDIVLLDLMLPDENGFDLLTQFLEARPETIVIVVTSNGSVKQAVEAMRGGAFDFLMKPFSDERLVNAVNNAIAARHLPKPEVQKPEALSLGRFQGSSPQMLDVVTQIQSVAPSTATVFITGESGTGKELCAEAIHQSSARADGPFVPLNCGAIPRDLLESEVFGHLKGSFTGAIADKPGAAEAADGGTLFLDEICEMDLDLQTKLLRFLESSTIRPVGASQPRKVDVRIICATNRNPMEEVRAGRFREDLFYRLHVVPIHMPPLRERGNDMLEIAESAIVKFAQEEGRRFEGFDDDARKIVRNYSWPGNIRQLRNVLRQCVVLNDNQWITASMLPDEIAQGTDLLPKQALPTVADGPTVDGLVGKTLAEIEQIVIEATIQKCGGSVPKASRLLDVSPSTLYRKRESWAKAQES